MDQVITADQFIMDQERLAGRKLSANERELAADWVETLNGAYADGHSHDREALYSLLNRFDQLLAQTEVSNNAAKFLKAVRQCIIASWEKGAAKSD